MLKKTYSLFLIVAILSISDGLAQGKPTGTWADVKALVGDEIAIKPKRGRRVYGVLEEADDKELKIKIARKHRLDRTISVFKREDIRKVWRAELFGEKNNAKRDAIVGGVFGAALGGIVGGALSEESGKTAQGALVGAALLGIPMALRGALGGWFSKKVAHKRKELVFKI